MRPTTSQPPDPAALHARRGFLYGLAAILAVAALVWGAYLIAQPAFDPRFDAPAFDAAYYLDWSDSILGASASDARFEGAFYRAPLYPYLLAALRTVGLGLTALYGLQLLLALAVTGWLALQLERWAGRIAGWALALLLSFYHPWLFFSARLLSESWALAAILIALTLIPRSDARSTRVAALLSGLATLARPNLLLVPLGWAALAWWRGERGKALRLVAGVALVIAPVTLFNAIAASRFVPVSANGGLTLYHGNGPGALGVYTPPTGMSGAIARQRFEATALASRRLGRAVDPVEADRYWGRQALAARLSAPGETIALAWNRALLTLGTHEIALGEAPALDPNPWSRLTAVPFALLLGLAAASIGARRRWVAASWSWTALLACAATPLIFYVSSRYRLPLALLLAVPAAIGVTEIAAGRLRALLVTATVGALSFAVPWVAALTMPYAELARSERATGHTALARGYHERALATTDEAARERWIDLTRQQMERSRSVAGETAEWLLNAGKIASDDGRDGEAQEAWLKSWRQQGAAGPRVSSAASLAAAWIQTGRAQDAILLTRQALELLPLHENCRNNLIVALLATGRADRARSEIAEAQRLGVALNPELVAAAQQGD